MKSTTITIAAVPAPIPRPLTNAPGRPRLYAVPTPSGRVVEVDRSAVADNLALHETGATARDDVARQYVAVVVVPFYRRLLAAIDTLEGTTPCPK